MRQVSKTSMRSFEISTFVGLFLGAMLAQGCGGNSSASSDAGTMTGGNLGAKVHVLASAEAATADGTEAHPFASPYDAIVAINAQTSWKGDLIIHEGKYELPFSADKTNRHANDIVVPKTAALQILPGAQFALGDKVNFHVQSDVKVQGTEAQPILFTWLTEKKHWGSFTNFEPTSANNIFEYAIFEHGGESTFNGAATTGTLALRGAGGRVSHCEFRFAEGDDAMNISGSPTIIEYSNFHDNLNDCLDANKASVSEARFNHFEHCGNDSIDAGEGSTIKAHHNVMIGSGDKGVSIGETSNPEVYNNLIVGCNIGIGIKDGSNPTITNNTLVGNLVGISNYEAISGLGAGKGTFTNGIIWGSINADIVNNEGAGTTTFTYSCIQSGVALVDLVPGSTPIPLTGAGILSAANGCSDPGFADVDLTKIPKAAAMIGTSFVPGDFHLKSTAGRFDPVTMTYVTTDTTTSPCIDAGDIASPFASEPAPNGGRVDLGAYGNTNEASKSKS